MDGQGLRVELVRSGGITGRRLVAAIDTASLPPDQAEAIQRTLAAVDFLALAAEPPTTPGGADRFQYDLTIRGETTSSASFQDGAIPGALQPVIDLLLRAARTGPSDAPGGEQGGPGRDR